MKQSHKTILLWVLLILMFVSVYQLFTDSGGQNDDKSVKELTALVASPEGAKTIKKVVIQPRENDSAKYVVHYNSGGPKMVVLGPYSGAGNDITKALSVNDVQWTVEPKEKSTFWESLIISWLPMIFLVFIFFFFMKQLQGGGGKAMNFGKSKARLLTENQGKITFKDVAGIEEAKEEVEEIIAFLKDPKKFTRLGGRIPKGVLLMGSPGTGKTLLARAIAGEASVPFFTISGSDFVEMFVGVGASRVRDLFEQGKKNAPCIIFIDEIDAVGRHRGAGLGGGHDEREQTLNQLLVEMDGFESNDGVILIAATNRPDVLDPALLRPGRFDRRINVPRPDVNGRLGILKVHTKKVPMDGKVDLPIIAKGTPGFSGADLENLTNEAALLAARRDKDRVEMSDFEDAKDKVLMGSERRSMFISEKEKRNTAMHEAGHALIALLIGGEQVDPLHKVTIIPRGRALGLTQQLPAEDRLSMTREYTLNRICIAMGGRCAEELVFGQRTTGAGNDIEQATDMARRMVTEWGMSELIGPLNYSGTGQEVFLGREMTQKSKDCSESTAQIIDAEVGRIVNGEYQRAVDLLTAHRSELELVGEALLQHETLSGAEISILLEGGTLERPAVEDDDVDESADDSEKADSEAEEKRGSLFPPMRPVGKKRSGSGARVVALAPLEFRGARWDFSRPLIQGVLNLTPDSFSDGGRYSSLDNALAQAERMAEQGADCLDLGGESTRPGAPRVSEEDEARRVLPVLEVLTKRLALPISIDTCKATVAKRAVEAGAELVNDVSGGRFDAEMFAVVDALGVAYICGHVPAESLSEVHQTTCESAAIVANGLSKRLEAMPAGMRHRVIVDPCLGFGKSLPCNIELMHGGGALSEHLDAPVLIGASRKRYLGAITGRPVHERDAATVGASLAAIAGGAHMVRVHNVAMIADALRVFVATPGAPGGE